MQAAELYDHQAMPIHFDVAWQNKKSCFARVAVRQRKNHPLLV